MFEINHFFHNLENIEKSLFLSLTELAKEENFYRIISFTELAKEEDFYRHLAKSFS